MTSYTPVKSFLLALLLSGGGATAQTSQTGDRSINAPALVTASDSAVQERRPTLRRVGDTLAAGLTALPQSKSLSWKSVGIPVALIGYGTLSFTSDWARDVNIFGRKFSSGGAGDPNNRTNIDDHTMYLPAVAFLGLHLGGVRGKNSFVDATLMYAISNVVAYNGMVKPLKSFTEERRPDGTDLRSFPSGHTASAFVAAEFLRQEYKEVSPWITAGGYGCAILTGYLRMYNNKHWFSDVVAGAGIGILSTRLTYWAYPKAKKLLLRGGRTSERNTMILPTYSQGYIGFTALRHF